MPSQASNQIDQHRTFCRICGAECDAAMLDLGQQPICNRFLLTAAEKQTRFPLTLVYCPKCALPQIRRPISSRELKPRFEWITYREPEPHLDDMVDKVLSLGELPRNAQIVGLSYKDTTTLERFRGKGFHGTRAIHPTVDLGISADHVEMETMQREIDRRKGVALAEKYGQADLLIARHILEHTHDTREFMEAISDMLKPGGTIVLEVPDFGRCMDSNNYIPVWEEHILYFNFRALVALIEFYGFEVIHAYEHHYALENALVAFARSGGKRSFNSRSSGDSRATELARWRRFAASFETTNAKIKAGLDNAAAQYGRIALFGAGHISCKFVNFFNIENRIEFVADNDQYKTGLFMPGSALPILPSSELVRQNIRFCLLGLSPESEQKAIQSHQEFLGRGGVFKSIFPANANYFI